MHLTHPRQLPLRAAPAAPIRAYAEVTAPPAGAEAMQAIPVVLPGALSAVEADQLLDAINGLHGTTLRCAPAELYDPTTWQDDPLLEEVGWVMDVPIEAWEIEEPSGQLWGRLWLCNVDCGTLYRADSAEVLAEIIQFHLTMDDLQLWRALADARREAITRWPGSELARRRFDRTGRCPACRSFVPVAWPPEASCPACGARFPVPVG